MTGNARRERWLVAAWPGIGQVATTAAVYLLSMLRMRQVAEFRARGIFELESVDITQGILAATRLPRSRFFLWENPKAGRDIVVFLGEAQPPNGKLALCEALVAEAKALGVTRVFSFSAIATDMQPKDKSRAFGVASDSGGLEELRRAEIAIVSDGGIAGLNGVVLAAAAEAGLPALGLLGGMPALMPQLPCPNASAAVLRVFCEMAGIEMDMSELEAYGRAMQAELVALYQQVKQALGESGLASEAQEPAGEPAPEPPGPPRPDSELGAADEERLERLFREAREDRSRAFALKKELDRLDVFRRYEDRFLDLFEG